MNLVRHNFSTAFETGLKNLTKTNIGKSPRKTLEFGQERLQASAKETDENLDQYLNIDNLPEGGLQVKVVYKTNSGNVFVRTPRDEKTKCLLRPQPTL